MAPSKKHPTNPNAPLYGKMPDLNIPSGLFKAGQSIGSFDSKCLGIKKMLPTQRRSSIRSG